MLLENIWIEKVRAYRSRISYTDVMNTKLLAVVTSPSILMVAPLRRRSGRKSSHLWTWKIVVVPMLGNTGRSGTVGSIPPWKSLWYLMVCTRWKSHIHSQNIITEYQEKGLITSLGLKTIGRRKKTRQGIPLILSVQRIFKELSRNLKFSFCGLCEEESQIQIHSQLLLYIKIAC